jgi:hypothetical protein
MGFGKEEIAVGCDVGIRWIELLRHWSLPKMRPEIRAGLFERGIVEYTDEDCDRLSNYLIDEMIAVLLEWRERADVESCR